jgi:uncharacterized membrane protein YjfL (UPF0719 family)
MSQESDCLDEGHGLCINGSIRWVFGICLAVCLGIIAVGLDLWGAVEIRASPGTVLVLTLIGAFWLVVVINLFSWLGLSFRDDVVERRNVAALVALCGAVMAVSLLYTGGNLGEGPSYLENFFSAGLGTAGWLVLWILLELGTKISISIAEERDLASGLRLGGFLLATGLLLGRAVAGNWESEVATIWDFFHDGWPAAALCTIALPIETFARPSRRRPFPPWMSFGFLPAVFYLALASAWLWHLGAWEGMPK